jgi:hypothetical protein
MRMPKPIGLRADWSLEQAIKQQVDKEDMVAWALKSSEPHKTIPPMPHQVWRPSAVHALLSKILP